LKHARPLPLEGHEFCLAIPVELAAHIGESQEGTPIDSGLAMDVDNSIGGLTQKALQGLLKQRIPV
jgi:hypothetical protein